MTIEKGSPWGTPGIVPPDAAMAHDDRGLALSTEPVQLTAGNVHCALGSPDRKAPGDPCTLLPVDALLVRVMMKDGASVEMLAAAEVLVGSWYGRSGFVVITNAGHLGAMNVTPRAHPNDGRFDILRIDRSMRLRERRAARRRALTGTHVPHPGLHTGSATSLTVNRAGRQRLRIDGREVGNWTSVTVTVMPDRFTVMV